MVDSDLRERASRVVSAIASANAAKRERELKPIVPLFHELCNRLCDILQSFTLGPVKCSLSTVGVESVDPEALPLHGSTYGFDRGEIGIRFRSDRSFESVLCEMCFGGTGNRLDQTEDNTRPPSKVEVLLKNMVLDTLHGVLPTVFRDLVNISLVPISADVLKARKAVNKAEPHVRGTLLLNVFSMSAELEVMLPLKELEGMFGAVAGMKQSTSRSMTDVLGQCPFDMMVALPAEEKGLQDIMALSVGSMLKLESRPSDLSILSVSGVPVGKGRLSIAPNRLSVQMM